MRKVHWAIAAASTNTKIEMKPNAPRSLTTEILTHWKFVKLQYPFFPAHSTSLPFPIFLTVSMFIQSLLVCTLFMIAQQAILLSEKRPFTDINEKRLLATKHSLEQNWVQNRTKFVTVSICTWNLSHRKENCIFDSVHFIKFFFHFPWSFMLTLQCFYIHGSASQCGWISDVIFSSVCGLIALWSRSAVVQSKAASNHTKKAMGWSEVFELSLLEGRSLRASCRFFPRSFFAYALRVPFFGPFKETLKGCGRAKKISCLNVSFFSVHWLAISSFIAKLIPCINAKVIRSMRCVCVCVCVCVCARVRVRVRKRQKIELTAWAKKVPIPLNGIQTCTSGIRAHRSSDYTTRAGTPHVNSN